MAQNHGLKYPKCVLTHEVWFLPISEAFGAIWLHLTSGIQWQLQFVNNQVFWKFTLSTIVQATWSKKTYFSDFSNNIRYPFIVGKMRKVWFFAPDGMNNRGQGKFSENLVIDKLEFSLNTVG